MTTRPLILVLGSGYHLYREYLLAGIAGQADVWLLLERAPTWELPYAVGSTIVDTLNSEQVISAATTVAAERTISGVICWDELRMITAAELASALGVPTAGVEAVKNCRDKYRTRRALSAAGVSQPVSRAVDDVATALQVARDIGYPVIVKPRGLGASIGVSRADSPHELAQAYAQAQQAWEDGVPPSDSVLVEECLFGEEISVDSAVVNGDLKLLFVGRKILGFPPFFEEVGHVVDADDPLLRSDELRELLQAAHLAVGFDHGITHTELMITAHGMKIIEINCRLGGDLIPHVAAVAGGIDAGRIAVEVAQGLSPSIPALTSRVARIDFLYPDFDVTVADVTLRDEVLPRHVHRVAALAATGQVLELPPAGHVSSRYGYVITVAPTADECLVAAAAGRELVQLSALASVETH